MMFVYSGYWKVWSRVLKFEQRGRFIEVNLTPIPGNSWENDVAPIRIRAHSTPLDIRESGIYGDKVVDKLPEDIMQAMIHHLGTELTLRLLREDFLPQIDWDLYQQKDNGGANLEDIRKI